MTPAPVPRSGLLDRRGSRAAPRYRSHSPLKARVAAYYAGSSDGKLSSSSCSRAAARALGSSVPLITATDVIYLPEYGSVALVPLDQPHLAYLSHAQSLPLLSAAKDIPVYPPVSTEKALIDIGSRVVSANSREAADSRSSNSVDAPDGGATVEPAPVRRRSRRDNGTDKEDEEPPHLYNDAAARTGEAGRKEEDSVSEHSSASQDRSEAQDTADAASRGERRDRC